MSADEKATRPVRIQLRRTRGYRLQDVSRAVNGLEAVKVDRTTRWGNPFTLADAGGSAAEAVRLFRSRLPGHRYFVAPSAESYMGKVIASLPDLRGKNLACWCKPGEPCHADVLLELANK